MKIYGASGHGSVILDILVNNDIEVEGFIDDKPLKEYKSLSVYSREDIQSNDELIIGIGDNGIRKKLVLSLDGIRFINAIHPRSVVSANVKIGVGCAIMAGAVINTSTALGNHVIVNTRSSIDHDCKVGDFVHLSPGSTICGGVTIGEGSQVGAGATILPNLTIGSNVVIGAGAVVTKDIPDNSRAIGIPARLI